MQPQGKVSQGELSRFFILEWTVSFKIKWNL